MLVFQPLPLSPADISKPEPFNVPYSVQDYYLEILAKQQLATSKNKMKEHFDKNKDTRKQVYIEDNVFV